QPCQYPVLCSKSPPFIRSAVEKGSVMSKQIAPYGSWRSPISAATLSSATVGLSEIQAHAGHLYWLESRPQQKGRNTVMRLGPDGQRQELLAQPFNARSRVNEYGGGSYCVD